MLHSNFIAFNTHILLFWGGLDVMKMYQEVQEIFYKDIILKIQKALKIVAFICIHHRLSCSELSMLQVIFP